MKNSKSAQGKKLKIHNQIQTILVIIFGIIEIVKEICELLLRIPHN